MMMQHNVIITSVNSVPIAVGKPAMLVQLLSTVDAEHILWLFSLIDIGIHAKLQLPPQAPFVLDVLPMSLCWCLAWKVAQDLE